MAGQIEEAFQAARLHHAMHVFADFLQPAVHNTAADHESNPEQDAAAQRQGDPDEHGVAASSNKPVLAAEAAWKFYGAAARYFEERAMWEPAADLHARFGNHASAVKLYMEVRALPLIEAGSTFSGEVH